MAVDAVGMNRRRCENKMRVWRVWRREGGGCGCWVLGICSQVVVEKRVAISRQALAD
jgi:hypothetical protein